MIKREMAAKARELWSKYPVLTLTGPRQSGKTTLARSVFPDAEYVNLEDPEMHALALSDMREFLRRHPAPAVFDEVQYVPELLRYVQAAVDEARSPAQYVLTGSHQPALRAAIGESLAGRTGLLELMPLTIGELALVPNFRSDVTEYTAATEESTAAITAGPEDATASVVIKNGSTTITNGEDATFTAGENTVTVTVTKGTVVKVYTVVVDYDNT